MPVVLMVWDINLREGRWLLVHDAVSDLDQRQANWDRRSTATVRVPWENTTDDEGLSKLKSAVGHQVYPLISAGKDFHVRMKLAFRDTPEHQEILTAFERHIKDGEAVTLKGRVIQELELPRWWQEWFGTYDPDTVEVHLDPTGSPHLHPVTLSMISNKGQSAFISNIEIRLVQAGTESFRLNNDHQVTPLRVELTGRYSRETGSGTGNVSLLLRSTGSNVQETQNLMSFLRAVSDGGSLQISFINLDGKSIFLATDPQPELRPDLLFCDLIDKLCFIQARIGWFLKVPEDGITAKDRTIISELYEIMQCGVTKATDMVMPFKAKGPVLELFLGKHRKGDPIHLELKSDTSSVELFGITISAGPFTRDITGFVGAPVNEFEAAISKLGPDEFMQVNLVNCVVIDTFGNWKQAGNFRANLGT